MLPLIDLAAGPADHRVAPDGRVQNAMSVDVEDYFHVSAFEGVISRRRWDDLESRVCRNTERLLDLFAATGVTATFFVLGWVAERFPGLIRRTAANGHEIACHGYAHQLVYDLTPAQFREDVRRAKGVLEHACGTSVHGYRAPSYSITRRSLWAFDVLTEEGFTYDASVYPIRHDRYGIPDAPRHPYFVRTAGGVLWEWPGATLRLGGQNVPIGGGGYFRLLPYAWTRRAISLVNVNERRPVIFYLHPWEIDPAQPRLHGSLVSRFRHYQNLAKTEPRLRRLLADFRFSSVHSVLFAGSALTPPSVVEVHH
jgi:polysaccharide deacetylase family protein (PEP-CTERM system associated)